MALFLVTCLYDEGIYESDFRIIEAQSREAVAEYILRNYADWEDWLHRSVFYKWLNDKDIGPRDLWESMRRVILNREDGEKLEALFEPWLRSLSSAALLEWIDRTGVDGDSEAQLAICEITEIEQI